MKSIELAEVIIFGAMAGIATTAAASIRSLFPGRHAHLPHRQHAPAEP